MPLKGRHHIGARSLWMPLGVHTSIAGGLHLAVRRAVQLGCDCFQMFGRNPRTWAVKEASEDEEVLFRKEREEAGLYPVAIHTTYLINLSSPDETVFRKSVALFKTELKAAGRLGVEYLVTHLGSSLGRGKEEAFRRVTLALKDAVQSGLGLRTMILFENSAGSGDSYGSELSDIGKVMDEARKMGLETGLCLDTCHSFASGYPMGSVKEVTALIRRVDEEAGLQSLKLIHLNDSKAPSGSNVDRHEHIGKGMIGGAVLKEILNRRELRGLPIILETPKKDRSDDVRNLKTVRGMMP